MVGRQPPDDDEREAEARWISEKLVSKMTQDGNAETMSLMFSEIQVVTTFFTNSTG